MGNSNSAHTLDEMTAYLNKTPFYVYFDQNELRDFAKCFSAKKIAKGSTINQTGTMYIVAQGEVSMTTMLEDECEWSVAIGMTELGGGLHGEVEVGRSCLQSRSHAATRTPHAHRMHTACAHTYPDPRTHARSESRPERCPCCDAPCWRCLKWKIAEARRWWGVTEAQDQPQGWREEHQSSPHGGRHDCYWESAGVGDCESSAGREN